MHKNTFLLQKYANELSYQRDIFEKVAKENSTKRDNLLYGGGGALTGAGLGGTLGYLAAGEEGALAGAGLGAITGYGGGIIANKYRPEIKSGFRDAREKVNMNKEANYRTFII